MRQKEETIGVIEAMEVKKDKAGFQRIAVKIECRLKNMLQKFKIISKEEDAGVGLNGSFTRL
jgi:hypothetical protein